VRKFRVHLFRWRRIALEANVWAGELLRGTGKQKTGVRIAEHFALWLRTQRKRRRHLVALLTGLVCLLSIEQFCFLNSVLCFPVPSKALLQRGEFPKNFSSLQATFPSA
jgi:hypothetical protein